MKTFLTAIAAIMLPATLGGEEVQPDENPIATISHDPGFMTILHHWGFIGDSLSSGELESRTTNGEERAFGSTK